MTLPRYTTSPRTGEALDYAITVLAFPEGVEDWDLVTSFMRLRKRVFVDQLKWSLHHSDEVEFEQYDTGRPVYVVAHRDRKVLGGGRLRQTSARIGQYRYMIYDAWAGLLDGMPRDLCDREPPVASDVWEFTRFAVQPGEMDVSETIMYVVNDYLRSQNAKSCLFLSSPALMRFATKIGYEPQPLGPVVGNHDGRFLAFSCNVSYS